jgi:hypothetical protein
MKNFKDFKNGLVEGHSRYSGDDMTNKELKIAMNSAKSILEMLEMGIPIQRWQISAIVKSSDELASVYTSMHSDHIDQLDDMADYDDRDNDGTYDRVNAMYSINAMYGEETDLDEAKSYELYHKDFSTAMKHAYDYAKSNLKITVDPTEIDDKVASGPRKPSTGKTNSYRLLDVDGKKAIQVQVYNTGKSFELNMYKESIELDEKEKKGLWYNIQQKRKRIKAGSKEKMRKPGSEGAPTDQDFKDADE